MQVNLGHNLATLASQGIGIVTLAPESTIFKGHHNSLVPVLPTIEGPPLKFYYIYPQHLKDSHRIQALGTYLHETVKKEGLS